MQALSAGGFYIAFDPSVTQPLANFTRAFSEGVPFDAVARIEIENQAIRMIQIAETGTPWVDLQHAGLGEAEQAAQVMEGEGFLIAVLALRWRHLNVAA